MKLTKKIANLTPEQREQFSTVKDGAALNVFTSEHGIILTEEEINVILEYINTGILPLDDDALDVVAGGAAKDTSLTLAMADGRYYNIPAGYVAGMCVCHHDNKWAKSYREVRYYIYYYDIRCYKCGKEWEEKCIPK